MKLFSTKAIGDAVTIFVASLGAAGVVATDGGWDLHVGGNGGIHVRATELLCKVTCDDEVKEDCGAFIQLYREEARYLERTAPWIERVGLKHVQERVVEDADNRKALFDRFMISQQTAQKDPWAERASEGVDAHEFQPLSMIAAE
jgi:nitrite reductase (NADH) large subunit